MVAFHEIQDTLQRITEAIAPVIGIVATVIDENLERVAGAGGMRL
jgi:hypothetical protein